MRLATKYFVKCLASTVWRESQHFMDYGPRLMDECTNMLHKKALFILVFVDHTLSRLGLQPVVLHVQDLIDEISWLPGRSSPR